MIERVVYVGQNCDISAVFMENGLPIQPIDPVLFPNYAVFDTDGDLVSFGIGTLNTVSNSYEANFTVPLSANISTKDQKWVIEWELVDTNQKSYKYREFFDVVYPTFNEENLKEQKKVTLASLPLNLHMPIPVQATGISFNLYDMSESQVLTVTPVQEGIYNDFYVYRITIPSGATTAGNTYSALWRFTLNGIEKAYYTTVDSMDLTTMKLISDLRLFMDKVLKPTDLYLGYRDSDLRFFLEQGKELLNGMVQWTTWDYSFYYTTPGFKLGLIYAAAWFGLNVQFLAEGDSVFDYGGQAVTLSVDRTGYISEEIGRLWEWLDGGGGAGGFKTLKKNYLRAYPNQNFHLGLSNPTVNQKFGTTSGAGSLAVSRAPWLGR